MESPRTTAIKSAGTDHYPAVALGERRHDRDRTALAADGAGAAAEPGWPFRLHLFSDPRVLHVCRSALRAPHPHRQTTEQAGERGLMPLCRAGTRGAMDH